MSSCRFVYKVIREIQGLQFLEGSFAEVETPIAGNLVVVEVMEGVPR